MGNIVLASTKGHSSPISYLLILVLVGFFYLVIYRPQKRRQAKASRTQNLVTPGQTVRTTAGIYGTVVSADDQDVVVQIAPGVEIRMMRRAIMDVIPDDEPFEGATPVFDDVPEESQDAPEDDQEPHADDSRSDDMDSGDRNA